MSSDNPIKWFPTTQELESVGVCANMMSVEMREFINRLSNEIYDCEVNIPSDHWCDECLNRWRRIWRMTKLAKSRQQRIADRLNADDAGNKRGEGSV